MQANRGKRRQKSLSGALELQQQLTIAIFQLYARGVADPGHTLKNKLDLNRIRLTLEAQEVLREPHARTVSGLLLNSVEKGS